MLRAIHQFHGEIEPESGMSDRCTQGLIRVPARAIREMGYLL
jgi:hypothetical protein